MSGEPLNVSRRAIHGNQSGRRSTTRGEVLGGEEGVGLCGSAKSRLHVGFRC